ncbi:MAG: indolepyruvate ferredoxin oxidoreductase family protein [bacterium]|nr:indolepyruvate ferredoxin oxidoreductase family protein [bacterium]
MDQEVTRRGGQGRDPVSIGLDDKYTQDKGAIYLSGIQALVRLPMMQAARDAAAGLHTAGFISGYRGSPLGGLDQQLWRAKALLAERDIRFQPGLNEELAATAVWGSQQLGLHPGARYDGVFGMWYGKAPGVDRACDSLRHANAAGTAPHGGVLAIAGDDHACKSSSYPSQSEYAMMHLEIPVLNPASVQDVLDYGIYGWALSRYAGTWVSLIALADVMDSSAVVEVGADRARVLMPGDFAMPSQGVHIRAHDVPLDQERRMREAKLPAVLAFARANHLNHVVIDAPRGHLNIVATGKAYTDTRQALVDLGIDEERAAQIGIRLIKVGMPWPLDPVAMREFCAGSDKVLVVEEKRPLVEAQLREALYELPDGERPRVVGKRDEHGAVLLAETGDLDSVQIARAIALQLPAGVSTERMDDHFARLAARETIEVSSQEQIERSPFFCSGCPHNRSTRVPEGSRALVGIGCHYMVQWMDRESDHFSQMGGEGVAWLGQRDFSDEEHIFANLGDGTYFHSGILAIRAAVAAGATMTYKLLFNDAVAMTGGQSIDGPLDVAKITRQLAAEGVAEIVVVSETPERLRGDAGLAPGTRVEPRQRLDVVQKALRARPGVTVLVYDQGCAAEKRRKRKRGLLEDPSRRVFINERLCEGCSDCSVQSNCLSVEPVMTAYGPKRRINQSSCNKDQSCLEGSCPALVQVRGGALRKRLPAELGDALEQLPAPPLGLRGGEDGDVHNIVLAGIGGTGVTTIAALLGMAAHLEGRASGTLDMTGLAQKGGAVVSHIRLADHPSGLHGTRVPGRSADLLLGCDAVVAGSEAVLATLHPNRSRSVVNTHFAPTAASVGLEMGSADLEPQLAQIGRLSRRRCDLDATHFAQATLGDAIGANLLLLGHAYQLGLIPLRLESIERAIELNGVAVEMNLRAFGLGRLSAFDPKRLEELCGEFSGASQGVEEPPFEDFVEARAADLAAYQNAAYAARYRGLVQTAVLAERERGDGSERFSQAVARYAYKLMAYKDEYEVARLYSNGEFRRRLEAEFEGDVRVELQLAPPLLAGRDRETGRLRKRSVGPWILRSMGLLARFKRLRGTVLDPFARLPERKLERRLVAEYEAAIRELAQRLSPKNYDLVARYAALAEKIRGYDRIKFESAEAVAIEGEALIEKVRAIS